MLNLEQFNRLILLHISIDQEIMFFIIEEAKETVLDFLQVTVKVL